MSVLSLKTDTNGDIDLSSGNLVFEDLPGQRLEEALGSFTNEWFLDPLSGMPWFELFLGKKPEINHMTQILRREILAVEGVESIVELEIDFDEATRALVVTFTAATTEGNVEITTSLPI